MSYYDLLGDLEGGNRADIYDPPTENSGPSVGFGFDLGQQGHKQLKKELSSEAYDFVKPWVGLKGAAAKRKLDAFRKQGSNLKAPPSILMELNEYAERDIDRRSRIWIDKFAEANGTSGFDDLEEFEQDALRSIVHHRGGVNGNKNAKAYASAVSRRDRQGAVSALQALHDEGGYGERYAKTRDYVVRGYEAMGASPQTAAQMAERLSPEDVQYIMEERARRAMQNHVRSVDPTQPHGATSLPIPDPYVKRETTKLGQMFPPLRGIAGFGLPARPDWLVSDYDPSKQDIMDPNHQMNPAPWKTLGGFAYDAVKTAADAVGQAGITETVNDPYAPLRERQQMLAGGAEAGIHPEEMAATGRLSTDPELISPATRKARMEATAALHGVYTGERSDEEVTRELEKLDPELAHAHRVQAFMDQQFDPHDESTLIFNPVGYEGRPFLRRGTPQWDLGPGDIDIYPMDWALSVASAPLSLSRMMPKTIQEATEHYIIRAGPAARGAVQKNLVKRVAKVLDGRGAAAQTEARIRDLRAATVKAKNDLRAAEMAQNTEKADFLKTKIADMDADLVRQGEVFVQQNQDLLKAGRALFRAELQTFGQEAMKDMMIGGVFAGGINTLVGDDQVDGASAIAGAAGIVAAPFLFGAGGKVKADFVQRLAADHAERAIQRAEDVRLSPFSVDEIRHIGVGEDGVPTTSPYFVSPLDPGVRKFQNDAVFIPDDRDLLPTAEKPQGWRSMKDIQQSLEMEDGRAAFLNLTALRPFEDALDFDVIRNELKGLVGGQYLEFQEALYQHIDDLEASGEITISQARKARTNLQELQREVGKIPVENRSVELTEEDQLYLQRRNDQWKRQENADPLSKWSPEERKILEEYQLHLLDREWGAFVDRLARDRGFQPDELKQLDSITYTELEAEFRTVVGRNPSPDELQVLVDDALGPRADDAAREYVKVRNFWIENAEAMAEDPVRASEAVIESVNRIGKVMEPGDAATLVAPPPSGYASTAEVFRDATTFEGKTRQELHELGLVFPVDPKRVALAPDDVAEKYKDLDLPPGVVGLRTNPSTGALEIVSNPKMRGATNVEAVMPDGSTVPIGPGKKTQTTLDFAKDGRIKNLQGIVVDGSQGARRLRDEDTIGVFVRDGDPLADEIVAAVKGEKATPLTTPDSLYVTSTDPKHRIAGGDQFPVRAHVRPGTALAAVSATSSRADALANNQAMRASVFLANEHKTAGDLPKGIGGADIRRGRTLEGAEIKGGEGWKALWEVMEEERRRGYFKGTARELAREFDRAFHTADTPFDAYKFAYLPRRDFMGGVRNPLIYFDEKAAHEMRVRDFRLLEIDGSSIPAETLRVHNIHTSPHTNEWRIFGDVKAREATGRIMDDAPASPYAISNKPQTTTGHRPVDPDVGRLESIPPDRLPGATLDDVAHALPESVDDQVRKSVQRDVFEDYSTKSEVGILRWKTDEELSNYFNRGAKDLGLEDYVPDMDGYKFDWNTNQGGKRKYLNEDAHRNALFHKAVMAAGDHSLDASRRDAIRDWLAEWNYNPAANDEMINSAWTRMRQEHDWLWSGRTADGNKPAKKGTVYRGGRGPSRLHTSNPESVRFQPGPGTSHNWQTVITERPATYKDYPKPVMARKGGKRPTDMDRFGNRWMAPRVAWAAGAITGRLDTIPKELKGFQSKIYDLASAIAWGTRKGAAEEFIKLRQSFKELDHIPRGNGWRMRGESMPREEFEKLSARQQNKHLEEQFNVYEEDIDEWFGDFRARIEEVTGQRLDVSDTTRHLKYDSQVPDVYRGGPPAEPPLGGPPANIIDDTIYLPAEAPGREMGGHGTVPRRYIGPDGGPSFGPEYEDIVGNLGGLGASRYIDDMMNWSSAKSNFGVEKPANVSPEFWNAARFTGHFTDMMKQSVLGWNDAWKRAKSGAMHVLVPTGVDPMARQTAQTIREEVGKRGVAEADMPTSARKRGQRARFVPNPLMNRGEEGLRPGIINEFRNPQQTLARQWAEGGGRIDGSKYDEWRASQHQIGEHMRSRWVGQHRRETMYRAAWKSLSRRFEASITPGEMAADGRTSLVQEMVDNFDAWDRGAELMGTTHASKEEWGILRNWSDTQFAARRRNLESLDPRWAENFADEINRFYTGLHHWDIPETLKHFKRNMQDDAWRGRMREILGPEYDKYEPFLGNLTEHQFQEILEKTQAYAKPGAGGRSTKAFSDRWWKNFGLMHELGFRPTTYNPVELIQLGLDQIDSFVMKARLTDRLIDEGLVVELTEAEAQGINRTISSFNDPKKGVRAAGGIAAPTDMSAKTLRRMAAMDTASELTIIDNEMTGLSTRADAAKRDKHYYAHPSTAMILRNWQNNQASQHAVDPISKVYKGWRRYNFSHSALQLGISAFHNGVVGLDMVLTNAQMAIQKAAYAGLLKAMQSGTLSPEFVERRLARDLGSGLAKNLVRMHRAGVTAGRVAGDVPRHLSRAIPPLKLGMLAMQVPIMPFTSSGAWTSWSRNVREMVEKFDQKVLALAINKASRGQLDMDAVFSDQIYNDAYDMAVRTRGVNHPQMGIGEELNALMDGIVNPMMYRRDIQFAMEHRALTGSLGAQVSEDYMGAQSAAAWRKAWNEVRRTKELTPEDFPGLDAHKAMWKIRAKRAGAKAKALTASAHVAIEGPTKWIFDSFVPAAKAKAFNDMFLWEVMKRGDEVTPDDLVRIGQDVEDLIDDRMGMMNYESRFLHPFVKKFLFSYLRAPGWQIGTVSVLASPFAAASKGAGRISKNIAKGRAPLEGAFTAKEAAQMGYMATMFGASVAYSNLYEWFAHGDPSFNDEDTPNPFNSISDGIEWLRVNTHPKTGYTRNGVPERMKLPGYPPELFPIIYGLMEDPKILLSTAQHKAQPGIGTIANFFTGQKYNGEMYSHPDADLMSIQGMHGIFEFFADNFMPFSFSGIRDRVENTDGRLGMGEAILDSYGVPLVPAGAKLRSSPSQRFLSRYFHGGGTVSPAEQRKSQYKSDLTKSMVAGLSRKEHERMMKSGLGIPVKQAKRVQAEAQQDAAARLQGLYAPQSFASVQGEMKGQTELLEYVSSLWPSETLQYFVPDVGQGNKLHFEDVFGTADRLYQDNIADDPDRALRLYNQTIDTFMGKFEQAKPRMQHYVQKMMDRVNEFSDLREDTKAALMQALQMSIPVDPSEVEDQEEAASGGQ